MATLPVYPWRLAPDGLAPAGSSARQGSAPAARTSSPRWSVRASGAVH